MTYISPSKVLAHTDRIAGWAAGEKPAPVTVEWDLSNRCSLGCQFCHFAHTHDRGPWASRDRAFPEGFTPTGGLADPDLVIRGLSEMAEAGVLGVVWSGGGEPTLHPKWRPIMAHAKSVGIRQGMYTLGGHLTRESAAELADLASWVVVSLDCVDAETYAAEKGVSARRFEDACNGVRWLSEASGTVGVSFLLHRANAWRVQSMVDLGRSLGATYVTLRPSILTSPDNPAEPVEDRGWITPAFLELLESFEQEPDVEVDPARFVEYRDWSGRSYPVCYGVRMNATITPDGRIWLCPQRRGVEGSSVGDLREDSFADIWASHPGQWTDFHDCRAMCRLHLMNKTLAEVYQPRRHQEFV